MKHKSITTCLLVTALACISIMESSPAPASEQRALRARGAVVGLGLIEKRAHAYADRQPGFRLITSPAKGNAALQALFSRHADFVLLLRPLTQDQRSAASEKGLDPVEIVIGFAGPAIITHPRNPVKELTVEQLRGIFTGNIRNWSRVNGPDEPIVVLCLSPRLSKPAKMFRKHVLRMRQFAPEAQVYRYAHEMVRACASSKGFPIGFLPYSLLQVDKNKATVKTLALKGNGDSPAVPPSQATFADGTYPIALRLYLCWDRKTSSNLVKGFADFCTERGATALSPPTRRSER